MDNLLISTSAKLTDRASKRLLPLLPKSPQTDYKIELDQSKVLLNEPEIISLSVDNEVGLFNEPDLLCLNEDPLKDISATDNSVPTVKLMDEAPKLQCKWEGCYRTCDSQAALIKHIEEDHVQLQIGKKSTCLWTNCSRESKSFIKKQNLLLHMRLHCGEKPYKCPFQDCNKAFSQLKTLEIHQRRHTGEKPYSCQFPNCLKSFSSTTCMIEHQRTHFASNTYDCQVNGCSKKYTDRGGLWKHMKTHTVDEQLKVKQKSVEKKQKEGDFVLNDQGMHYDTKLYTCHCLVTGCSQKYTTSRSLWTHMKKHTVEEQLEAEQKLVKNTKKKSCVVQEEPSKNFEILRCEWEDCYQVHDCQAALVKHIEKNHIQFLKCKEFACFWSNCPRKSKPFISKRNLLTHIRVHSGEKPHRCQFQGCNKAFSRVDILKIHQRSHTGERPYLCQFPNCFKSFSDYSCRHKHQKTHFNTKPYVCQVSGCSKEYKDTSVLWKHLKKNHTVDEQLEHNQNRLKKLESDKNKQKEDDFIVYQI